MQWISYLDKREVLQQEYSQPPILPSPHFRWVVNHLKHTHVGMGTPFIPLYMFYVFRCYYLYYLIIISNTVYIVI